MNLQQTVSVIVGQNVSEEDAMAYARDNFGVLAAFLRRPDREELKDLKEERNRIQCRLDKTENLLLSVNQYGRLKNGVFTYTNTKGVEFCNKMSELFL